MKNEAAIYYLALRFYSFSNSFGCDDKFYNKNILFLFLLSLSRWIAARSISEEFSSGDAARLRDEEYASSRPECSGSASHSRSEQTHKSGKDDKRDKEKEERDEETIKVFDGNLSLRRRIFRAITVPRQCTLESLLTTSLRAFHITRDPNAFYLTDLYAPGNEEMRVQDPHPVLNLHHIEGKRPAIFLRFL